MEITITANDSMKIAKYIDKLSNKNHDNDAYESVSSCSFLAGILKGAA